MKIQIVQFVNGKYGIRHLKETEKKKEETFLNNKGHFRFGSRRTNQFSSFFFFEDYSSATLRVQAYAEEIDLLQKEKNESKSPVQKVLGEIEIVKSK